MASHGGFCKAFAKAGQFSLGAGYFYDVEEFRHDEDSPTLTVKQNQVYVQGSYGFIQGGEIYLRGGVADVKFDNAFIDDTDFSDNFKPFGTLGIKMKSDITPMWGVGFYLQGSIYSPYKDERTETVDIDTNGSIVRFEGKETIDIKNPSWEVDGAIALQAKVGVATFYIGPLVYWERIPEVTITETGTMTDLLTHITVQGSTSASTDLKEKQNWGGFVGLRLSLGKRLNLEAEAQLKEKLSAGAALSYAF